MLVGLASPGAATEITFPKHQTHIGFGRRGLVVDVALQSSGRHVKQFGKTLAAFCAVTAGRAVVNIPKVERRKFAK